MFYIEHHLKKHLVAAAINQSLLINFIWCCSVKTTSICKMLFAKQDKWNNMIVSEHKQP